VFSDVELGRTVSFSTVMDLGYITVAV